MNRRHPSMPFQNLPALGEKSGLSLFVRKLLSHSLLSEEVQNAVASLPYSLKRLDPGEFILREGDRALVCPILLSGYAFRHKITAGGDRQIVALKIPGDPLDFQSLYMKTADHNLQALTTVELAVVALADLESIAVTRPPLARAVLVDILIEASIAREWMLNLGRRNAIARMAHFLCELHVRLHQMALPGLDVSDVPLTQEQLADILGLTTVHVNRTLKSLEERGAVRRQAGRLRIIELGHLRFIAGFSDLYLHRENTTG